MTGAESGSPPRIVVTMGEPGGIGPEVVVRALDHLASSGIALPLVVGDPGVMTLARNLVGSALPIRVIQDPGESREHGIAVFVPPGYRKTTFPRGRPSAEAGTAVAAFVRTAVNLCASGQADALVTAPIAKESLKLAGLPWPGHTEFLAELTSTDTFAMMLVGGPLRVVLVTIHASLAAVPALVTRERVLTTIRLAARAARMLNIPHPRIAVAGLNPHGGEGGLFGEEERERIAPAVAAAAAEGIGVQGPFPPDTVFHHAYKGRFDIVVCMYHDQGLIPLKMIAFDEGVNVTVGLPFVRTSPDHGTAFDIAWRGTARPESMIAALRLASSCRAG